MWNNFKMWRDLLSGNYEGYALLKEDDPYQECYKWFWASINMDECLGRDFLDYLQQMVDRIDRGEEKLIPFENVEQLFEDLHNDEIEDVETGKVETYPMTLEELDDISHLLNREEEEEWE